MKLLVDVFLFVWLILIPIIPHFTKGILHREISLFPIIMFCFLLLIVRLSMPITKKSIRREDDIFIFSILDIFVGLFICYSAITFLLLEISNIEALTILKWTMVIAIYITFRNINRRSCIILHAIASSSFVQAIIIIAQKIGYAESTHIIFNVTGTFGNPGQAAGYISMV